MNDDPYVAILFHSLAAIQVIVAIICQYIGFPSPELVFSATMMIGGGVVAQPVYETEYVVQYIACTVFSIGCMLLSILSVYVGLFGVLLFASMNLHYNVFHDTVLPPIEDR